MSNNPPDKLVSLTKAQWEFLISNCDSNIAFGLANLQNVTNRSTAEKLVEMLEQFKAVKKALEAAE